MARKKSSSEVGKKDTSPRVYQREKITHELNIRERDDLTEKQIAILKAAIDKDTRCIMVDGIYGSAKSYTAVLAALKLLNQKKVDQIIYVRNPVESSTTGRLGYLKGPQPEYAKILTPDGWITMGDIQKGDIVCTPNGENVEVLEKYELGEKSVYKLTTLDGREVFASKEHLWEIQENNKPGRFNKPIVVTTEYIRENLKNRYGKFKITLPSLECLDFPERDLPIDPYVLGVLIGDGYICGKISFSSIDEEIVSRIEGALGQYSCSLTKHGISYHIKHENAGAGHKQPFQVKVIDQNGNEEIYESPEFASKVFDVTRWNIQDLCRKNGTLNGKSFSYVKRDNNFSHPLKTRIMSLGLFGKKAWDKFIPDSYKFSSKEQRYNLLRGLMDTDGTIAESHSECTLTTTSLRLAEDVKELVIGLGGKSSISVRDRRNEENNDRRIDGRLIRSRRLCYSVNVSLPENPFFLKRKADRFRPKIKWTHRTKFKSVEFVGQEKCWCIKIDCDRHLYLTDGMIPTHNTMDDKMEPYASILYDKLEELLPKGDFDFLVNDGRLEAIPLGFTRGKSWACKAIIVDESSSMTYEDFVLLLTRCGEFTRIFFIGDSFNQADIKNSGFRKIFDKFNDEESKKNGIHCFELTEAADIVRSGFVRFVLERLEIIKPSK